MDKIRVCRQKLCVVNEWKRAKKKNKKRQTSAGADCTLCHCEQTDLSGLDGGGKKDEGGGSTIRTWMNIYL
jgi:hypothetical protein